jgi:hypothetical protein
MELISNRRKRTILSDYKRHIPGATAFTIREGAAEFTAAISNYTLGKDPGGVDAFIHELDWGLDRVIAPTLFGDAPTGLHAPIQPEASWESWRSLW